MNSKLREAIPDIVHRHGLTLDHLLREGKTIGEAENTAIAEAEKAIRQAVGEEMLELVGSVQEYDEGDGWDIVFSQADTKNAEGKVIKKGKKRSCCPGDDIAYVRNMTIAELRQKIKEWQGTNNE